MLIKHTLTKFIFLKHLCDLIEATIPTSRAFPTSAGKAREVANNRDHRASCHVLIIIDIFLGQ